jgi:hypothetical protein
MNEDLLKYLNNQYDLLVEERNQKMITPQQLASSVPEISLRNPFSNNEMKITN